MRYRSNPILLSLPVIAALFSALPAHAQDLAAAEALFKKGIADMEAGQFATACPAIEESNRLDPRVGTVFTLAECEAKAGKIATAVARYEDYLRAYGQLSVPLRLKHAERAKVAKKQVEALTPQIPELTLALPAGAPGDVHVMRDGVELSKAALGIALPVDPGEHMVTTQAPGGPVGEQKVTLAKGEKKTLTLEIKLPVAESVAKKAPASPPPLPVAAVKVAPKTTPVMEAKVPQSGNGQRVAAYFAGGLGLAGLGLGAVTGIINLGNKSTIDANCVDTRCNPEGMAAVDRSKTMGLVSTVGFGVGVAGIATSVVLLLTAPSAKKTGSAKGHVTADVLAGPGGAVMGVKGAF